MSVVVASVRTEMALCATKGRLVDARTSLRFSTAFRETRLPRLRCARSKHDWLNAIIRAFPHTGQDHGV